MKKMNIMLNTINDVKEFVNAVTRFEGEIDVVSGRYAVDAKSIMGIFSLDLSRALEMQIHDGDDTDLLQAIDKFIVK